jgi:superfamily I DNA and/or RNA helicase
LTLDRNPGDKEAHRFQPGSPVLLFDPADNNKFEKAVVIKVDDRKMIVQLYGDELSEWLDEINPGVQIGFDSRSYQEMEFALNRVINAERNHLAHLRDVILGLKEATFNNDESFETISTLNTSQNEAIKKIVDAQEVALVHGPPGTGKTTTLVAAVKELCKSEERILVCAPSNAAVDHLSRKLQQAGLIVLRIGHSARIGEDINAISLEEKVRNSREYSEVKDLKRKAQEFRNEAGKFKRTFGASERARRKELYLESRALIKDAQHIEEYIIQKCISEAQAITCTLVGSSAQELRDINFETVFIDEAGQALEPMCWIPILKAKRVVMAGDPYQLPPVVKNTAAAKGGLESTLMEKCLDRTKAAVMLNVQYRMNEAIMGFSNEWFYRGHLTAHNSVAHHLLSSIECALEFIDTAGCGFNELRPDDATSIRNEGEAAVLVVHYRELIESLGFQPDTGIISPYREQVRLLREMLNESDAPMIQSVDAFQGQERDLIYVSLVRSNEEGEIGFLKDYRRSNVAMTRARKKLVIIGDSATLANDAFYESMLKYIEKNGLYRSAWEWMDKL